MCLSLVLAMLLGGQQVSARDFIVIIDAGHGGHDIGAPGRKVNEEDVNLDVALRLGSLIGENCKGVKVVYTRSTDKFINLNERPRIANNAKGDLFISIHCNSVERNRNNASGAFVYVPGKTAQAQSLEVVRRENGDMGVEPDSEEVQMMNELLVDTYMGQSLDFASMVLDELVSTAGRVRREVRAADFRVLRGIQMPAVLVELDYICNPEIEKFLASSKGKDKLARAIYNGLRKYMKRYNVQASATALPVESETASTVITVEQAPPSDGKVLYKVQFLTSREKLDSGSRSFRGLTPVEFYEDNGVYKYTYGSVETTIQAAELLRKVKAKFPDAFIIKMCNGKRVK